MKLLIGGDLVPTKANISFFCEGRIEELLSKDLINLMELYDFRIVNLECPLTNSKKGISKMGPALAARPEAINSIKLMNIDCVNLSNNHIRDYGDEGILDTLEVLKRNCVDYIGVANNAGMQKKYKVFRDGNVSVCIYSCCEHEFSYYDENRIGAIPIDLLYSFDEVEELKNKYDFVIVLYHGGRELFQYPMPFQKSVMRRFAEKGADLVIAQHSHCIGCREEYNGCELVYGQGNFLFNEGSNELLSTGLLISVCVDNSGLTVEYYPIQKTEKGVALADETYSRNIMSAFNKRSEVIQDEGLWIQLVDKEVDKMQDYLYRIIHGNNTFAKVLSRINPRLYRKYIYRRSEAVEVFNAINCETHRDIVLRMLRRKLK